MKTEGVHKRSALHPTSAKHPKPCLREGYNYVHLSARARWTFVYVLSAKSSKLLMYFNLIELLVAKLIRGWSLCEIIDQAGAGFYSPGQQQMLLFPLEAGQDDYIKEICSPEGLVFNPA